jgi:hypothetical protein
MPQLQVLLVVMPLLLAILLLLAMLLRQPSPACLLWHMAPDAPPFTLPPVSAAAMSAGRLLADLPAAASRATSAGSMPSPAATQVQHHVT